MTTTGGAGSAVLLVGATALLLTHVLIFITGSPGFPLIGGVQGVLYAAVMLVLVATSRATRLTVDRARTATEPSGIRMSGPRLRGAA